MKINLFRDLTKIKFLKPILELIHKLNKNKQQNAADANDAVLNADADDDIVLLGTSDLPNEQGFVA